MENGKKLKENKEEMYKQVDMNNGVVSDQACIFVVPITFLSGYKKENYFSQNHRFVR